MDKYQRVGHTLWVHKDGRTFVIALDDHEKNIQFAKGAVKSSSSGKISSPMPGKILKLDFKLGQKVRKGQTVCLIEAMKMEYALKSPFDGKIKELHKKSGDQVFLDEKIMFVAPEDEEVK